MWIALAWMGCTPTPDGPTWHADVQPFLAENCAACHVDGGVGPFPFQDYDEVVQLAPIMLGAMESGVMPPWPADAECRDYLGDRTLDDDEVEAFREWVLAGFPEGEAVGAPVPPPTPTPLDATHSDQVPGYVSTAEDGDEYRCFVLDIDLPETRYLTANQVVAGSAQVHHVLAYALREDQRDEVLAADAASEAAGYPCFGSPLPDARFVSLDTVAEGFPNQIGAWVPGLEPTEQAPGDAIRIDAGSVIVLQVHYSAVAGDPEPDHTELQLVMSSTPPERLVRTVPLLIPHLEIPAGSSHVPFTETFRNFTDDPVEITSFTAHMHLLGDHLQAEIVRTDGSQECGLDIPDWDFDWQITYLLDPAQTVVLQPGDGIELTCAYDNSAANQPIVDGEQAAPRTVTWGDGTLDEMCILYLSTVAPYTPPPDESAPPCEDTEACVEACGDSPTADCLMRCPEADADCAVCMLQEGYTCGFTPCAAGFLVDQECITTCLITTLMFGGSTGECLAQECPEQFDPFASCAEDPVSSGSCDSNLRTCGWAL